MTEADRRGKPGNTRAGGPAEGPERGSITLTASQLCAQDEGSRLLPTAHLGTWVPAGSTLAQSSTCAPGGKVLLSL